MVKGERITEPATALRLILDGAQLFRGNKLHTNEWLQHQAIRDIKWWVFKGELRVAEEEADGVDQ